MKATRIPPEHKVMLSAVKFLVVREVPLGQYDNITVQAVVYVNDDGERSVSISPFGVKNNSWFEFDHSEPMIAKIVAEAIAEAAERAMNINVGGIL